MYRMVLDDDQKLLAKTAAKFVAENSPVSRFRALRDEDGPLDRALYRQMAELGWLGLNLPEDFGGLDLGFAELVLVFEAAGSQLMPEPLLGTVLATLALLASDAGDPKSELLPLVAAGERTMTLAHLEPRSRYDVCDVRTRATPNGAGGYRLKGRKTQVIGAAEADVLLIPARLTGERGDQDGIGLFLVEPGAEGLEITPQRRVDLAPVAIVDLDDVTVGGSAVISQDAGALLEQAVDRATVALCGEMLGGMSRAFEMTVAYLKERKQFGVPIGSFQALKHRAASAFTELTLARSAVMAAARTLDTPAMARRVPAMVSLAKARCNDAYMTIAHEGVQMFGGVGMTDEYDIGLYLKRARAAELTFGDSAYHRDRWATLAGY